MHNEEAVQSPVVVIGDEDVVLGFRALGFRIYGLHDYAEARAVFQEVVKGQTAICLVQEEAYRAMQEDIESYKQAPLPIFIPFSKDGKMHYLDSIVRNLRIRATGSL